MSKRESDLSAPKPKITRAPRPVPVRVQRGERQMDGEVLGLALGHEVSMAVDLFNVLDSAVVQKGLKEKRRNINPGEMNPGKEFKPC